MPKVPKQNEDVSSRRPILLLSILTVVLACSGAFICFAPRIISYLEAHKLVSKFENSREEQLGQVYAKIVFEAYKMEQCAGLENQFLALEIDASSNKTKKIFEDNLQKMLENYHEQMNCGPAPSLRWASLADLERDGLYKNNFIEKGLHAKVTVKSDNVVHVILFKSGIGAIMVDYELEYDDNIKEYQYKPISWATS